MRGPARLPAGFGPRATGAGLPLGDAAGIDLGGVPDDKDGQVAPPTATAEET